jgi:hypothetical protein
LVGRIELESWRNWKHERVSDHCEKPVVDDGREAATACACLRGREIAVEEHVPAVASIDHQIAWW